jgi:hypothetical protein
MEIILAFLHFRQKSRIGMIFIKCICDRNTFVCHKNANMIISA